jgi:hypothetical protein
MKMLLATKLPIQIEPSANQVIVSGISLNSGIANNVATAGVALPKAADRSAPSVLTA